MDCVAVSTTGCMKSRWEVVQSHQHDVGVLIADTVRGWDTETVTARVERQVGEDLQYIRSYQWHLDRRVGGAPAIVMCRRVLSTRFAIQPMVDFINLPARSPPPLRKAFSSSPLL